MTYWGERMRHNDMTVVIQLQRLRPVAVMPPTYKTEQTKQQTTLIMSTFTKGHRNHSNKSHDDHQGDAIATRRARDATIHVQEDTKASIERTLAAAAETTALGATTLDELYRQRQKLEQTLEAGDRLNAELDKTEKMQNTLSRLGGWNHWGQRNEAKKIVKQDLKMEQADQERKQARRQEHQSAASNTSNPSSSLSSTASSPSHGVVVEKKQKSTALLGWKKEKPPVVVSVSAADKKALGGSTYGLGKNNNNNTSNNDDKEQDEYLRRIEATDQEIDVGLNAVDNQLDQLLDLAQTMQNEVRVQTTVLNQVDDQMQDAKQKQKVATHRIRRFF